MYSGFLAFAFVSFSFAQENEALETDLDPSAIDEAQEEDTVVAPSCPVTDSLRISLKKPPKGLVERAFAEASLTGVCVDSLFHSVGEKHPHWKKFRKSLPETQPDAMLRIYPVKKLSLDEQKSLFFSKSIENSDYCMMLADSIGLTVLSGKDWLKKTTVWDTTGFPCKYHLASRVLPLIELAFPDSLALRNKLLAVFPEAWFTRYAKNSSNQEKVSYAINPALRDSSHCRFADYDTPILFQHGLPTNACRSYIDSRYGDQMLRDSFRKAYKPSVLTQINNRMATITPENTAGFAGFFDTLEVIVSDGETWEAVDSLQNSLLRLLAKNPQAIKQFQEPTADMLFTAINAQISLMCDYPDFNDRMLNKLISDRIDEEKPLPTAEEIQVLQSCLTPELLQILNQLLQPR
jgi:hypothetical protein